MIIQLMHMAVLWVRSLTLRTWLPPPPCFLDSEDSEWFSPPNHGYLASEESGAAPPIIAIWYLSEEWGAATLIMAIWLMRRVVEPLQSWLSF